MVRSIEVNTVLKYLGEGMSEPALVVGSDFQRYIMKTQKVINDGKLVTFNCMFLNELLSYLIASFLEVPVPEAAVANLDRRLIDRDPEIMFVHRFYEGIHFASLELKDKEDNLIENYAKQLDMGKPYTIRTWKSFFDNILNADDIARIVAFDVLIGNFDRYRNTGNLLVSNDFNGRKIFTIDHGHSFFGPVWNTDKMNILNSASLNQPYINMFVQTILQNNLGYGNGFGEVFRAIETSIDLTDIMNHSFMEIVADIESIDEPLIDSWMAQIPDSWFIEKSVQISFYKKFILSQKDLVKHILQNMASRLAFSNYRGGVLSWKQETQVGTV